jgi:hypothetical protein
MSELPMISAMPAIPVTDIRNGGPLRHAQECARRARALRDDCLAFFPRAATPLVPTLDGVARRWLTRSRSPYVPEIAQIAASLGFPGVWFLNGSYIWGCTSLACEEAGSSWLARTLDWPFPGLGRHVEVAQMQGPAGEFFSVTWPGYAGALTAMAPGRFSACLNQAPLRRRTRHPWLRLFDLVANALNTWTIHHIPPDQLLRQAFETCGSYAEARRMLETEPVARPVIYTLAGCAPGERCVIERTEEAFVTHENDTCAANDWIVSRPDWEARIIASHLFTSSAEEAMQRSRARRDALVGFYGSVSEAGFDWVTPPVLNPYTRIAAVMCAARGILRVAGYEVVAAGALPERVTQMREVQAWEFAPAM